MNYTFKLSRRLARFRAASVLAASLFTLSCAADGPNEPGSSTDPTRVSISPETVTLGINQTTQFEALLDSSAPALLSSSSRNKGRGRNAVVDLTVTPHTYTLGEGSAASFTAVGTLRDGSTSTPSVTWTATGGTIDASGRYTAGPIAGNYSVSAKASNGVADTATVIVAETTPTVTNISLSPTSTSLPAGGSKQFTAVGTASGGDTVPVSPKYAATGGSVSSAGMYHAGQTPGNYRVIAADTVSGKADTSAVTITASSATLQAVVLTPSSASLATGGTKQFAASGTMSDGSTVPLSPLFTATGGTISSSGDYTAGSTAGSYHVIAKDETSGKADTSSVTITATSPPPPSPTLQAIVLTPTSASLAAGATQQFTASGKMSDGSTSAVTVTWSAAGGTISSAGLYTAGQTAGTFRAIATQSEGSLADTATVTVTAPTTPPPSSSACAGALRTVNVSTASALNTATSNAQPGDCIIAAAGTYALGTANWTRSGTAAQPITLEGTGSATVFTLGGSGGIYLKASHWRMRKLRVTSGFFGIQVEGGTNVVLDSLEVDHMRQAAINLFYGTHNSTVRSSRIHDTGEGTARYGEGIYIGGYSDPSRSAADQAADDNNVLNNRFGPNVRAEAIEIAAGADRVTATGNNMDGTGTVFEYGFMNSLISVQGVGHQISDNVLSKGAPHGIVVYAGSATFHRNRIAVFNLWNYAGVGINRSGGTATVYCDNQVTDIPPGGSATNVTCTP